MAKKAAWILVLVVALVVISASVVFATSVTRSAHTFLAPTQELSASGKTSVKTLRGLSGGSDQPALMESDSSTHCHRGDASAAY